MKKNIKIALKGEIVLQKITDYQQSLEKALDSNVHLILDLEGVTQLDGAGLQFLLSFAKHRKNNGKACSFSYEANPLVREIFKISGAEKII